MIEKDEVVKPLDILSGGKKAINDIHLVHHVHHDWNDSLTAGGVL